MPRPTLFKPVSPPSLPTDATISVLIDEGNQWNEGLVYQYFVKEDADMITQIPLPRQPMMDQVLWHYDKKGNYTVNSGYQVALKIKFPDFPSCSNYKPNQWHVIWNLVLPEKIKVFIWGAAKNLLPTVENLWKRKILEEPFFQVCRNHVETIFHALIDCKSAWKVWKNTQVAAEMRSIVD